jgi:hypothetical protein
MPKEADKAPIRPVWSIISKGIHGTGKTIFSCGKEFRPVYVLNCEGRMESVISYYRKIDGHVKDVYYDDYHMATGFFPLDKRMDELAARPGEYKTVVVSSLTSFVHIVMSHLMRQKSQEVNQQGKPKGKKIGGIPVNVLEDYNAEDAAIIYELCAFLQDLKNNGVNVILEAHITPYEITTIDPDTSARLTQTIFQILTKGKKAPAQIPNYFNDVWLFEKAYSGDFQAGIRKPQFKVNTLGNETSDCKSSVSIPPFDWTGIDGSIKLMELLDPTIKETPRIDPNAPKRTSW